MIKIVAFDLNGVLFPTSKEIDYEVLNFVKECKDSGYMVVAASNSSKGCFEWRSSEFGLMDVFDGRIISSDIGIRKPSVEFFEYMVKVLGYSPEEVLFVDDTDANIESAKKLGIIGIKYEDANSIDKIRVFLQNDREGESS